MNSQPSLFLSNADWRLIERRRQTLRGIFVEIGSAYGIPLAAILGPSKISRISKARQHGMAIAHRHGFSTHEIGNYLARDHTTVCHGIKVVKKRMTKANMMAEAMEEPK